jgi:hypothetical protein
MISSPRAFRSGERNSFALLKARSHPQEVAGQARVSKAHRRILGNCCPKVSHQEVGFEYCSNTSSARTTKTEFVTRLVLITYAVPPNLECVFWLSIIFLASRWEYSRCQRSLQYPSITGIHGRRFANLSHRIMASFLTFQSAGKA